MKLFSVLVLTFSAAWGAKKCNTGTDSSSLTETECTGEEPLYCTSPMFVEYTGISSQAYGCQPCGAAKDTTCKECTAVDGSACNTAVTTPTDAHTFECYAHSYDSETKKFKAAETATTCHALQGTAVKCNSPGAKAPSTYEQIKGGCGPCADGTVDDETCTECDKTGCNSATSFTFVFVSLMAALFNLF